MSTTPSITLPPDILPRDGRFCCGPAKVRPEALEALAATGSDLLGTSHRQYPVQFLVGELRNGLAELFALPDGYEVVLGNGGTTAFWDAATFGLIERHSQHLAFGEFSAKFAGCASRSPHLEDPEIIEAPPGTRATARATPGIDAYCLTHNETSTGVIAPLTRPEGADPDSLVLVDATSAAGGVRFDASQVDVYYFAPQKCLSSEGGLWLAACSPAAIERMERLEATRWCPQFLSLKTALDNSRKDQTLNTPALATIFLANHQVQWILSHGGLEWSASRCDRSAGIMYGWADASDFAEPFVGKVDERSPVVATIDLDPAIDAKLVSAVLRENGILDTDSYRKLGRNQLRMALFPSIDPEDVAALTRCIDHVVEALA